MLLGRRLEETFVFPLERSHGAGGVEPSGGATKVGMPFEYALFDLVAKRLDQPVYAVAAMLAGRPVADLPSPFRVPCYDTSLYFDDLNLADDVAGAALIADEAREGYERGHRAFKIKVGRGAMHMELEAGTRRDIAVIHAVRAAVGNESRLMSDANCGYNVNLVKRVLSETADCGIFWLEEAFHEDAVLYRQLKEWLHRRGFDVLIADGEGQASPSLLEWAREGLVDVVQYNYLGYGFTRWLATGAELDSWGVKMAPHTYGGFYGNYASGHLAAAVNGFVFVEWDEASALALDASAYAVKSGLVTLPNGPGFGLHLDPAVFSRAVVDNGFVIGS